MRKSAYQKHITRLRRVRKMNTPGFAIRKKRHALRLFLDAWIRQQQLKEMIHQLEMQKLMDEAPPIQRFFIWMIFKVTTFFSRLFKKQAPKSQYASFKSQASANQFATATAT